MSSLGCVLTAILSIYLIARQSTNCMLLLLCCFFFLFHAWCFPPLPYSYFSLAWPFPQIIVIRQNTGWCSVSYDAHTTFLFLGKSNKHYPIRYLSFNMLLSVVNILLMESEKDAALTKCSTKCLCITTRFKKNQKYDHWSVGYCSPKFVLVSLSSFSQ